MNRPSTAEHRPALAAATVVPAKSSKRGAAGSSKKLSSLLTAAPSTMSYRAGSTEWG
ncbi:hypothetical protein AB0A05_37750 [Streptomyces sp. NPDC046374]|uniref:hypothetical protein n=1 Tax=Streptomyces sp. NPDC046374 TaxID=3154917 RepID=UPI0033FCE527